MRVHQLVFISLLLTVFYLIVHCWSCFYVIRLIIIMISSLHRSGFSVVICLSYFSLSFDCSYICFASTNQPSDLLGRLGFCTSRVTGLEDHLRYDL